MSQKQNGIHWSEGTPPSLGQKQTSTSTSSWRDWSLWLRALGVVVALVGGFAFFFQNNMLLVVFLLVPFLEGVVSAGLLRSWWAMLIVPVAFSVGLFLSSFLGGGLPNMADPGSVEGAVMVVFLGVVPVAIGAAIGTTIGKWVERRLQQ